MSTSEQQQKASQEIRNVVDFLRSSKAGLKNRVGVLNGKRVDYFKGMMRLPSPVIPPPMRCILAIRQVRCEGIVITGVCKNQEYP
jgi:hypothetical protein